MHDAWRSRSLLIAARPLPSGNARSMIIRSGRCSATAWSARNGVWVTTTSWPRRASAAPRGSTKSRWSSHRTMRTGFHRLHGRGPQGRPVPTGRGRPGRGRGGRRSGAGGRSRSGRPRDRRQAGRQAPADVQQLAPGHSQSDTHASGPATEAGSVVLHVHPHRAGVMADSDQDLAGGTGGSDGVVDDVDQTSPDGRPAPLRPQAATVSAADERPGPRLREGGKHGIQNLVDVHGQGPGRSSARPRPSTLHAAPETSWTCSMSRSR